MTLTAPEITAKAVKVAESFDKVVLAKNKAELIVVIWDSEPTKKERNNLESDFQTHASPRLEETEITEVEDGRLQLVGFDFENAKYGKEYSTYYLAPVN